MVGARRILKYIPKVSRIFAFCKFTTVLEQIMADPSNVLLWKQSLLFTYSCFGVGDRGGKKRNTALATKVNNALCDFMDGSYQPQPRAVQ